MNLIKVNLRNLTTIRQKYFNLDSLTDLDPQKTQIL